MLIQNLKGQTAHEFEVITSGAKMYAWVDANGNFFYKHIKRARFSKRQVKKMLEKIDKNKPVFMEGK